MKFQLLLIVCVVYGASGGIVAKEDTKPLDNVDVDIVPLIVGGTLATAGEFRGKISIQYENGTHICGGTLINDRHVLTLASCVTNNYGEVIPPNTYRLMGDDLSISVMTGNPNRQLRSATHVFVHPEFNLLTSDHNIAIIRVDASYTTSATFNPVSRPQDSPPVNTQCSIAGWGAISDNGPISYQLRRTDAVVISRATCNSATSYNGAIRGGMFCAGNMAGGQGTCQRDEGGGLICNNLVFGVVAGGLGCAVQNFPAIYTDVAVYNSWIDSVLIWGDGEHDIVPTPTSVTTTTTTAIPTTTPPSNGALTIVNSVFVFTVCTIIAFLRQ